MLENRHDRRALQRNRMRATLLRLPSLREAILIPLALIALAIQVLVVQTHIHIPEGAGRLQTVSVVSLVGHGATTVSDAGNGGNRDKYPINEDPSNCPLCQELAHSGQFVHSVVVLVSLPVTVTTSFIVLVERTPFRPAASHIWRGRAPPQA
jgi:Protein of unknown function (DUF2946)